MNKTVLKYSDKNPGYLIDNKTSITNDPLLIHTFVYNNDLTKLSNLINALRNEPNKCEILNYQDNHGNTALHLAAMLGNLDAVKILIDSGATVKIRNSQMWTPLNEAVSYGDRELIKCILAKYEKEVETLLKETKPRITNALKEMNNFYVEIKWEFESWIPFIGRLLPSDLCKLYKYGSKIRVDCTLEDIARSGSGKTNGQNKNSSFSPLNWQRGNLTFILDLEDFQAKTSIIFLDHTKNTYSIINKELLKQSQEDLESTECQEIFDIEREVDALLSREIIFIKLDTHSANFIPTQTGWFTKKDKIEIINGYSSQYYDISNLFIVSKIRSEHISDEEFSKMEAKQKQIKENFKLLKTSNSQNSQSISSDLGQIELEGELFEKLEYRPSLPEPPKATMSWEEYIESNTSDSIYLRRKHRIKENKKEFKAQIAMSQEFPMTLKELNELLEALVPLAKFRKLKEFISLKLPPGFPVKIDIPIIPAISAKVCFLNFNREFDYNENLFKIPTDYKEENIAEQILASAKKPNQS